MRGEIHVRLPPGLALRVGTEVVDVQAGGESQSQTVFVAVGKFGERQQGKPPPFGRIDLKEAAHRLDERGKTARGGRIHCLGRSEGQILALHFEAKRGEVRRAGPFDGGKGAGIVRGAHGRLPRGGMRCEPKKRQEEQYAVCVTHRVESQRQFVRLN